MSDFPCTGCGQCCKQIYGVLIEDGFALEDGSCKHLQPDNSCGIYETRPDVCRMSELKAQRSPELTDEEFHQQRANTCNRLQEYEGVPIEFRVILE